MKAHTAQVMPVGSSCRILLQSCGFGRKAFTLTLSALLCTHTPSHHQLPPGGAFTFTLSRGNYPCTGITLLKDTEHQVRRPGAGQQVGIEPGSHSEHPCCRPSSCTSAPFLHNHPTCSTSYFYPSHQQESGAAHSTGLLLLHTGPRGHKAAGKRLRRWQQLPVSC